MFVIHSIIMSLDSNKHGRQNCARLQLKQCFLQPGLKSRAAVPRLNRICFNGGNRQGEPVRCRPGSHTDGRL
jgi:hypothetical protein